MRRRESGQFALFGEPSGEKPARKRERKGEAAARFAGTAGSGSPYEKETLGFYITGHPLDSFAGGDRDVREHDHRRALAR